MVGGPRVGGKTYVYTDPCRRMKLAQIFTATTTNNDGIAVRCPGEEHQKKLTKND